MSVCVSACVCVCARACARLCVLVCSCALCLCVRVCVFFFPSLRCGGPLLRKELALCSLPILWGQRVHSCDLEFLEPRGDDKLADAASLRERVHVLRRVGDNTRPDDRLFFVFLFVSVTCVFCC